jgi:hypothetical protein
MRAVFVCLSLVLTTTLLGCASSGSVDPNTPETCVTVDNTGGSDAGRVYLIGDSRERIRIGEVPMGRTVTQCIRRSSFAGRYQLVIESGQVDRMDPAMMQNQPGAFRSEVFTLVPGDHITWDVRLNRTTVTRSGAGA